MSTPPRTGRTKAGNAGPGTRGGPSVRQIGPAYELVFTRFVGKLEKLVPQETRAGKDVPKSAKPRGRRP